MAFFKIIFLACLALNVQGAPSTSKESSSSPSTSSLSNSEELDPAFNHVQGLGGLGGFGGPPANESSKLDDKLKASFLGNGRDLQALKTDDRSLIENFHNRLIDAHRQHVLPLHKVRKAVGNLWNAASKNTLHRINELHDLLDEIILDKSVVIKVLVEAIISNIQRSADMSVVIADAIDLARKRGIITDADAEKFQNIAKQKTSQTTSPDPPAKPSSAPEVVPTTAPPVDVAAASEPTTAADSWRIPQSLPELQSNESPGVFTPVSNPDTTLTSIANIVRLLIVGSPKSLIAI